MLSPSKIRWHIAEMLLISVLKSRAGRREAIAFLALSLCHGRGEDPSEVGWHRRGTKKLPPWQSAAQGSLQPMASFGVPA